MDVDVCADDSTDVDLNQGTGHVCDDADGDLATRMMSSDTTTATTVPAPTASIDLITEEESVTTGMSSVSGHCKCETASYHSMSFVTAGTSVVSSGIVSGASAPIEFTCNSHHGLHSSLFPYAHRSRETPAKRVAAFVVVSTSTMSVGSSCKTGKMFSQPSCYEVGGKLGIKCGSCSLKCTGPALCPCSCAPSCNSGNPVMSPAGTVPVLSSSSPGSVTSFMTMYHVDNSEMSSAVVYQHMSKVLSESEGMVEECEQRVVSDCS